jgi:hypothetical protein
MTRPLEQFFRQIFFEKTRPDCANQQVVVRFELALYQGTALAATGAGEELCRFGGKAHHSRAESAFQPALDLRLPG